MFLKVYIHFLILNTVINSCYTAFFLNSVFFKGCCVIYDESFLLYTALPDPSPSAPLVRWQWKPQLTIYSMSVHQLDWVPHLQPNPPKRNLLQAQIC